MNRYLSTLAVALVAAAGFAPAHDTWVQTNTNLVRTGDAVHIELLNERNLKIMPINSLQTVFSMV